MDSFRFVYLWISYLKSQIATSKIGRGGKHKLPFVFTELGVAMLSSVLNSDKAIEVNIQIMRVFTRLRKALLDNVELRLAIEELKKSRGYALDGEHGLAKKRIIILKTSK